MLTVLDALSLAGDRAKQNDDAYGVSGARAWVIDGATDLYAPAQAPAATDAAWLAHSLNALLHAGGDDASLRAQLSDAAGRLRDQFAAFASLDQPGWRLPAASVVLAAETPLGLDVVELGDSRLFALGADGAVSTLGGAPKAADNETEMVRALVAAPTEKPLEQEAVLEALRQSHAPRNKPGGWWAFGVDPACADHARFHQLTIARPGYVLLMTDGFAALADRYGLYDPAGLIKAAREIGLSRLAEELRAFETADATGASHPRFKKSDDATAVLVRLD